MSSICRHGPKHAASVHRPIASTAPAASTAITCRICVKAYLSTSALEQHYRDTPVHPKCTRCKNGFLDNAAMQAVSSYYMLLAAFRIR